MLMNSDNQELTGISKVDLSNNMTVIEQKIPELGVSYKQNSQRLEQQKSILVTSYVLNASLAIQ